MKKEFLYEMQTVSNTSTPEKIIGENPYLIPWYLETFYGILFLTMVVISTAGNLIVIWIIVCHRRMRTVTNYFLVNLAFSDVLMTIFNTMFNFIYMCKSNWFFGKNYCKFTHFIVPYSLISSVCTFVAISIDR